MKNLKLLFYVFKWLALAFLTYLLFFESSSKIMMVILIGFLCALLVWEGFRDFKTKK